MSHADLRDFVQKHGGSLAEGGRAALIPGPNHSKRDRSLSLRLTPEGRVIYFDHSGSHSHGEIASYLGLDTARRYEASNAEKIAARRRHEAAAARLEAEKLAFCEQVWSETVPFAGSPGETYLAGRRLAIDCSDIRWSPAAPRAVPWNQLAGDTPPPPPHPAMVLLARDGRGTPRGLHITFITEAGKKAFGDRSRIMAGPMVGAAFRSAPIGNDGVLALAEGMETAGAFARIKGVPTWAAFSTSGLRNFQLPVGVKRLLIAADNDANGAGMAAAEDLAKRARTRCDVEIFVPDEIGDWADVLMKDDRYA